MCHRQLGRERRGGRPCFSVASRHAGRLRAPREGEGLPLRLGWPLASARLERRQLAACRRDVAVPLLLLRSNARASLSESGRGRREKNPEIRLRRAALDRDRGRWHLAERMQPVGELGVGICARRRLGERLREPLPGLCGREAALKGGLQAGIGVRGVGSSSAIVSSAGQKRCLRKAPTTSRRTSASASARRPVNAAALASASYSCRRASTQ